MRGGAFEDERRANREGRRERERERGTFDLVQKEVVKAGEHGQLLWQMARQHIILQFKP